MSREEHMSRGARASRLGAIAGIVLAVGCGQGAPRNEVETAALARVEGAATGNGLSRSAKKAALETAAEGVLQAWATLDAAGLATDETKIPHYFGPFPNWANSPRSQPDAQVIITGNGTGATATATVGAGGAVTGITVTNPGNGYTAAQVQITGSGTGATAKATILRKGFVRAITLDASGSGYSAPTVTLSGGGSGSGATATAYGRVDLVTIVAGGSGYTFPTVDFDLPDGLDGVQAKGHAEMDLNGTITAVVLDSPGSGYSVAPGVAIRNGTLFDPIPLDAGGQLADAAATLSLEAIAVDAFGTGYTKPPTVTITDPTGTGATATATIDTGGVVAVAVQKAGSGYVTPGGIKKFVDTLPGLGPSAMNNLGQYIPVAVADQATMAGTDLYVIALVQHREKMHSSLPPTLLREYVQLSTAAVPGRRVPLRTDLLDGTSVDTRMPDGSQAYAVDDPHFLGPTIVAQKDRAVRIVFYNLLPKGSGGDLFLPVDSTMMGSGEANMDMPYDPLPTMGGTVVDAVRNPMCTQYPKMLDMCFADNRATLHLHGGNTPWISDGTPHQWITPAAEGTPWPQGVSVREVPDMSGVAGVPDCSGAGDGCETFYYTNQQSARLMFYHDHSWGITRLNVYAGEAAGYLIQDPTEKNLVDKGVIPLDQIPLVIQDRTFVPQAAQLAEQDPTWDASRWGGHGNLWYHHVYMPAQNPGDPSGMSAFGRWMYGPWFWPPAGDAKFGPIANPYYDPSCILDVPSTWQYDTDPFCEPELIPGTPNISAGMEQFNDTPIVNGTAYPTVTLGAKAYRLRILNAANDRFWNLQWYVADSTGTEVALKADEVAAAQLDPVVFPTPDTNLSPAGPSWIQIGTEGGFLPAPVVVPNQPITWITDPTRFDVGNVDQHSLLVAPAERADVIVDFSKFAGKTLILYNDAPAAFPARDPELRLLHGRARPEPGRRPADPARLRAEHPHDHAGQDRERLRQGVQPERAPGSVQAPRRRLGRVRVRPAPDHRRTGRVQLGLRHRLRLRRLVQLAGLHPQVRRVRAHLAAGRRPIHLRHAERAEAVDPARAEGDPRRDERVELRRVREDAGEPGRGGRSGHAGLAERRPASVHVPGDRDHRHDEPAVGRREGDADRLCGRNPDLEDHAQRRGHASDPLPRVRRAGPEPGHVGQHHHPA